MTIQTSDSAIKLYLSQLLPADMTYVKAKDVVIGSGRFKRRQPRRVGYTKDGYFSIEMYGRPAKLDKLVFMSLADRPPIALARSLAAIRGIIERVLPQWEHWKWLVNELESGRDAEKDGVKAYYSQIAPNVTVLFLTIG